jgi:hypothetical protein
VAALNGVMSTDVRLAMLMWLSTIEAFQGRPMQCVIREVGDAGLALGQTRKLSRYISDKPNQVADYTL